MKKMSALMICLLMLLLTAVSAFGEAAVPSVTITDKYTKVESVQVTTTVKTEVVSVVKDEVTGEEIEVVEVVETPVSMAVILDEPTEKAQEVLTAISAHIETAAIAEYFAPEIMETVVAIMPENTDMATLKVDEFYAISTDSYSSEYGAVEATFSFATTYEEGKKLVAMIGVIGEDGEIIWMPMPAEVIDGMVKISFTQEVLEMLTVQEAICALMSAE